MKKFILLLVIAGIAAGIYFYLDFRKKSFIEKEQSNNQLRIDNPSNLELRIVIGNDSIEVPANSMVFFPVNESKLASAPVRIRSYNSADGKLITDSTLQLSSELFDYFLNPSLSRYISFSKSSMILAGYHVDNNLNPVGGKTAIVQDYGSSDTVYISSLLVNCKETVGIFDHAVNNEKSSLQTHTETTNYLLRDPANQQEKPEQIFYSENWEGFWNIKKVLIRE